MVAEMRILGNPGDAVREASLSVLEGVLAGGAFRPQCFAIDDGNSDWIAAMAAESAEDRSRSVAAVADEGSLVMALRLGVGGAVWLPTSSLGILEALEAAGSTTPEPSAGDASLVSLLLKVPQLALVSFPDLSFWRRQLGPQRLATMLHDLSLNLGAAPAVVSWPALVVGEGIDAEQIRLHWQTVVDGIDGPTPDLCLSRIQPADDDVLGAVYRALVMDAPAEELAGVRSLSPVRELPGGEHIGWWGLDGDARGGSGWMARPVMDGGERGRWIIDENNDADKVEEVLSIDDVAAADGLAAVRVPGWVTRDLRPGTPAGLLLTHLAEAAARRGLPLWIPNLEKDGLHFALCLPGKLWVDGAAVPQ